MNRLFDDIPADSDESPRREPDATVVAVAVNANLWGRYDYLFPNALGTPAVGQRVRVPFGRGNRTTLGFITEIDRPRGDHPLKSVAKTLDTESPFTDDLRQLADWMSRYYLTPPGMVLAAMIPSAVGRHAPKRQTVVFLNSDPQHWPDALGVKQRTVLDELLEARRQGVEPLSMEQLLTHSNAGRDSIQRLIKRDLVRTESRQVTLEDLQQTDPQDAHPDFPLNADQQAALDALCPALGAGFGVHLLHGVTGSGKTEVYVRAIRQVVDAGRQAILLCPEIALSTQTLQRLLPRLPRVAVLHSGLTEAQRAFTWQQIRDGYAAVVVGPRSAIFAPTGNLGLVIVDEEHESGYKQDTAPPYHGRDVAVKRASLVDAPVLMGSATPSMESWHNARTGKYHLLELPRRVRNLPMPQLQIVNLRSDLPRGKIELIGGTLTQRMAQTLDRREQIILLMNRRGYASYVFCPKCNWMLMCDDCMRPMVWHQTIQLCRCHHCDRSASLPEQCPACGGKVILFGYGIQRIEDELARKFPLARLARMDSDTMTSPKQFQNVLQQFADGQVDILLGTQMVAKGLDFPKVTLVGVVSADTSLAIHDFRAGERTFQLIVQVSGRAGRGQTAGQVVVQTLHEDDPAVALAQHHDYKNFAEHEIEQRKQAHLPPFTRLVRILVRHENMATAEQATATLHQKLQQLLPMERVTMTEPMPAEFIKIRSAYRFNILLFSAQPGLIQKHLATHLPELTRGLNAEILPDCDPINLL
jgi:primosomal protein N' (replication factor Y) (superfamily II helicase)